MDELWRGPTQPFKYVRDAGSFVHLSEIEPGTEVAVVRVDSLPTREQVRETVESAAGGGVYLERIVDAVMALFGQTEGDRP
jgi:hypothetical protein